MAKTASHQPPPFTPRDPTLQSPDFTLWLLICFERKRSGIERPAMQHMHSNQSRRQSRRVKRIAIGRMTYKMQDQNRQPVDGPSLRRMESVSRISKIPIVESAWGVASGLYGKVKDSNSVVSWTLNHAEVVSTAALVPVASRLETPLHAVDNILCKGIDIVEEKVPVIKMPPRQILDSTREYVAAGLGKLNEPAQPDAPAAKKMIVAGVGVATAGIRTAVSAVEWCVEKYLPAAQDEEDEDAKGAKDAKALVAAKEGGSKNDPREVMLRIQRVSRRIQRRLVRIASAQIKSLKQQQEDATSYVGGVALYITSVVTDPKALAAKLGNAWAEMARQLNNEEADKDKGIAKVMVRRFARRVVGALDGARGTIGSIQGGVYSKINSVAEYGYGIVGGFLNGSSKSNAKDPSNGHNSEERAKLLCMRQFLFIRRREHRHRP
ncbi:lipid storage droplets surface-binding protein 2-like isoform X2 [Ischnura elegans]|uniref:lipid storage droplets surface-binding protein 2-like isoform X2 n=1 Tax=Ischnura elegans TaxID=197161 RepID=UPI001ED8A0B3|nr:lipid storage droplets surface-binding protein 2-like isoform X2 [Ischnura elegans]